MEDSIEKIIRLIAESDNLTTLGEKYINYLYFEAILITVMVTTVFSIIGYLVYKSLKEDF